MSAGCGKDTHAPEPAVENSGAQATQQSSSPGQVTGKAAPSQEVKPAPAAPEVKAAPMSIDGVPDLALEVVSTSDLRRDGRPRASLRASPTAREAN